MSDNSINKIEQSARDFLDKEKVMVVSTIAENDRSQCAPVYFVSDDDFNFYFMTHRQSNKLANIKLNYHAGLAVGFGDELVGVQGGGSVKDVSDNDKIVDKVIQLVKKMDYQTFRRWPLRKALELSKDFALIQITPEWLVYMNLEDEAISLNDGYHHLIGSPKEVDKVFTRRRV